MTYDRTETDPVIPRAAIVATTEARYAHRDASGPHGAVKCRCGQSFRTGVEQLQHASHAILTAAIPHLQGPLVTDPVIPPEAVKAIRDAIWRVLDTIQDRDYYGQVSPDEDADTITTAVLAALPHLRPLVDPQELRLATQVALKLGRQEALAISWQQLQDAADRWRTQSDLWDRGTKEQRGTPQQVADAWEHAGELRCWSKHLNRADILLDAPEIGTGETP